MVIQVLYYHLHPLLGAQCIGGSLVKSMGSHSNMLMLLMMKEGDGLTLCEQCWVSFKLLRFLWNFIAVVSFQKYFVE